MIKVQKPLKWYVTKSLYISYQNGPPAPIKVLIFLGQFTVKNNFPDLFGFENGDYSWNRLFILFCLLCTHIRGVV